VDTIDGDGAAEDSRVRSELAAPKRMTEDHQAISTRLIIASNKRASEFAPHAEHGEEVCGNGAAEQAHGLALPSEIESAELGITGVGVGCEIHGSAALSHGHEGALGILAGWCDQAIRVRIRKRPK